MPHATINGARLWYEVLGQGEPLLLHHGYTASRDNWMPVAERLCDRYQIILMECRGAGESEHTDDGYSLEQYARDVLGLAAHLALGPFTFGGHSMGGGCWLSARHSLCKVFVSPDSDGAYPQRRYKALPLEAN